MHVQDHVYVIDSLLSVVLNSPEHSYIDVIPWFTHVVLDNVRVLIMGYHEE